MLVVARFKWDLLLSPKPACPLAARRFVVALYPTY